MDKNEIDKLFKDGLKNIELSPSSDAWNKISAGLDQKRDTGKVVIWYRYMAIAASLVILITAAFLLTGDDADEEPQLASIIVLDTVTASHDSVEIVVEKPVDSTNYLEKPRVSPLKTQKIPKTYIAENMAEESIIKESEIADVEQKPFVAFSGERYAEVVENTHQEEKNLSESLTGNQLTTDQAEFINNEEEPSEDQEVKGLWKKFKRLKKGENPDLEKIKLETQRLIAAITNTNE